MGVSTVDIPESVRKCIEALLSNYRKLLESNLVGMYVHGSIAMGCFNPKSSDIDVLVVVTRPISNEVKKQLGRAHLELSNTYQRNIEISVITNETLRNFVYPTSYEFHYSDDHKQAYLDGTIDFETTKQDYDLAAHFVIVKKYGITLAGELAKTVFPDVPRKFYVDSIVRDSLWSYDNIMAGSEAGYCRVPQYAVLNFCRVLAFIKGGLVTSKQTGAEWAQKQLPSKFQDLIEVALSDYQITPSSSQVNARLLKEFAQYVLDEISRFRLFTEND